MSILTNRVIFSDNGTLTDQSIKLNNQASGTETWPVVAAEDFIYIGSELPFNQRYIRVATANTAASSVSVDLWDNSAWAAAVDVQDQSSDGTATLSQSGALTWKLDKTKSWGTDDTDRMTGSGLETLTIYDLYWARISFSADLDVGTAVQNLGYKFNDDEDLGVLFPELNTSNAKTQFSSGKTDWEDQELEAASFIIRDLQRRNVIISANQILDATVFQHASVYKLAELIFTEFGSDYIENRELAKANYLEAINGHILNLDENKNARLDTGERIVDISLERR